MPARSGAESTWNLRDNVLGDVHLVRNDLGANQATELGGDVGGSAAGGGGIVQGGRPGRRTRGGKLRGG